MRKIENLLSSAATAVVLMIIYAVGLAVATFIEKYMGTVAAKSIVYYSPLFILLQFLMIVNFLFMARKYSLFSRKKWGAIITHFSFIVILCGAFVSHVFSEEGIMHIREGEKTNVMEIRTSKGITTHNLPFEVELTDFILTRYPGSSSPSSYESKVNVYVDGQKRQERIYMNNVLDLKGYRFFQASYDRDELGTVLSVSRDVAGRTITYVGYALLFLGLIICLVEPNSRFMQLNRQLKRIRESAGKISCVILLLAMSASYANAQSQIEKVLLEKSVPVDKAELFGELPVQSISGRMIPMNTFSSEILRKVYNEDHFKGLNSDQFLLSFLAMPNMWVQVPFISLPSKDISSKYNLTENICAYVELFDSNGAYKLQKDLEEVYQKMPAQRTRLDKDLLKLDEQANLIYQLMNFQLIQIFPQEEHPEHKWYAPGDDLSSFSGKDSLFVAMIFPWYIQEVQKGLQTSDWAKADELLEGIKLYQEKKNGIPDFSTDKIKAEIKYNNLDVFRTCKKGYLILGGLLLVLAFVSLFNYRPWIKIAGGVLIAGILLVFAYHIYGMGFRWYIAGYAPWSNSYETMVYVAWATVLAGLVFMRRSVMTMALATLFGGIILFVSGLSWMDPQISPLVPVLKSPWLMFHVAVIVAAYGFFGICCLIGLTNMALIIVRNEKNKALVSARIEELTIINEMSMLIGLVLMTIGTFLGAIWANESWGRYWGWDPKETWALITMIVYALVSHLRLLPKLHNKWSFNFLSVIAFLSVLMTFFGVNYFLSGMHSYGENDNINGLFVYIYSGIGLVVLIGIAAGLKYRK